MDTMSTSMGPMILGLPFEVALMFASGIFYAICAAFLWKPLRAERNELISALFAFLVYQSLAMIFMALEMHTMNMLYSNLAALSILVGSAYMLKFVWSSFSSGVRRILFMLTLIALLGLFTWFMMTPERQMTLMHFVLWYDIVINGVIVGGAIIMLGIRTTEHWLKVKTLGGGSGVVACCVVANATMLGGAMLVSSVFQFLAPVVILSSLAIARKNQK